MLVIEATPLVTVAVVPLKETPVKVPVFLVNPQPLTVDSVTAAGMFPITLCNVEAEE